jgi:hypothetical protein
MLGEVLRQTSSEKTGERQSFRDWAERVPEPKTGPLNFDLWAFQLELYLRKAAECQEIVIKKATQIGVSTYLLRWIMYHVDLRGLTGIYFFPTEKLMYDFADARIKAAIRASKYLRERISREYVDNKGLKQIGTGLLYCRGSESVAGVQSVDADILVMDEYEELRRENIPDMERRLGASEYGLIRRVGVPDIPNVGLDRLYQESDQRQWIVKCDRCGEHQDLNYENVDEEKLWIKCRHCHKGPLNVRVGEWVAQHPDRPTQGYHMPKFIAPLDQRRIKDIVEAHRQTSPSEIKTHFNKDLALAYAPEEGRLSLAAIERAQRPELALEGPHDVGEYRTMGVDVASTRALNVRISAYDGQGTKRSIYLGKAEDFNQLVRLFKRYQPHFACIDHEPDGRMSRAFAEKFPGRVWLVASSGTQKEVMKPNADLRFVSVNRTLLYDATFEAIRLQRNLLPGQLPEDYARDMQNLIRRVEVNEEGKSKIFYERIGPEDYAQAEMYDMVAEAVWQWTRSVEAGEEGETFELEDEYDFERSQLDGGSADYNAGFDDLP